MSVAIDSYKVLTQAVSADLASLRTSTTDLIKAFGDLGHAASAEDSVPQISGLQNLDDAVRAPG